MNRRKFLTRSAAAAAGFTLAGRTSAAEAAGPLFSAIGISAPLAMAQFMKSAGIGFLTEGVGSLLVPDKPDDEFEKKLAQLQESPLPVLACGGFIRPPELRCVGKEANHEAIAKWAETAFRRLAKARGKLIVFGSGSSRELRDGWPREKADVQFVALLQRLGPLAEAHGITIALEQLRADECNYINHLAEAAALVRKAEHPHVRLLADLYHMASMGDTPADLKAATDVIAHVEIAEKEGRTVPGVHGDDFRPYFSVLRENGYAGAISMEGRWTEEQIAPAVREIRKQASEA